MGKLVSWISAHGLVLLVGVVCFVLGVAISVPLGWKLPDTIASLLGSIAGAVGTVGGAFLLWQVQENRNSQRIGIAIAKACSDVRARAHEIDQAFEVGSPSVDIVALASNTARAIAPTKGRLQQFQNPGVPLSGTQQVALFDVDAELTDLANNANQIANYGTSNAFNRNEMARKIYRNVAKLDSLLEQISPGFKF